jgi:nucleotide-binding universal stress UspA family protein
VLTVPSAAVHSTPGSHAPILVPVDFSDANREALAAAHLFAARFDAPVELLHVADDPVTYADAYANAHADAYANAHADAYANAHTSAPGLASGHEVDIGTRNNPLPRLRRFDRDVGSVPASRYHLREGRPGYEIAAVARRIGAGLIVMATHGRTGWTRVRLGSVTEQTLRRARCPVLSLGPEATRAVGASEARSFKTTLMPEARGYGAG